MYLLYDNAVTLPVQHPRLWRALSQTCRGSRSQRHRPTPLICNYSKLLGLGVRVAGVGVGVGGWGGGWSSGGGGGRATFRKFANELRPKGRGSPLKCLVKYWMDWTSVRGTQLGIIVLPRRFSPQWADRPDLYTDQASLVQWDQPSLWNWRMRHTGHVLWCCVRTLLTTVYLKVERTVELSIRTA